MTNRNLICEQLEHRRLLSSSISIGTVVDTAMRQTAHDGLIVVSRKGDLSEPLVVPLIVGGTAQNVAEYGRIGPRLTIPIGENSVAIPVRPVFPGPAGQSNYVSVSIGEIEGIRYGNRTAVVSIVDNPDSTTPTVATPAPGTASRFDISIEQRRDFSAFVITRSTGLSARETVDLAVGGDAQNGVDFGVIGNQVTFEAGQNTIVLPVRTPEPTFTGNRSVTVSLPGALPVSESSLVLNGIDLSGNIDPFNPPIAVPDPVFPDSNPGIGIDPNDSGVDTGVGFDPNDGGLSTGVGFEPNEGGLSTGVGLGSGFSDDGVRIGADTSVGNTSTLPGAAPTSRRG